MNRIAAIICVTSSMLGFAIADPDVAIAPTGPFALATGPPVHGDSAVHYAYNRQYDYGHHYVEPIHHVVSYGIGPVHHSYVDHYGVISPAYGYQGREVLHINDGFGLAHGATVKHGYKQNHAYGGYEHEVKHEHHLGYAPKHSGYVPEHGKAIVDHGVGYAVGHDAIGHFDHHTGPFGPFGFYANYYHD